MGWRVGPAWLGSDARSEQTAADARLIAAAPKLLAALQGMLFDDDQDEARRNAVAAIAEAEGNES
jgi:hypothetical protein